MSNGAQAAKGNAARATARAAPRVAMTDRSLAQHNRGVDELLLDDSMDTDGILEASQISQTQIIERQADSIARLERHAARDKEYRTVTKVKLKEAAARLKEYRLRVEALLGEVDAKKTEIAKLETEKKKALAQVEAAKKKPPSKVAPAPKKVEMKTVAVQTPWKKALRTVSVQTELKTVEAGIQVDEAMCTPSANVVVVSNARAHQKSETTDQVKQGQLVPSTKEAVTGDSLSTATSPPFDPIGAAIDAELEFSDDDNELEAITNVQAAISIEALPGVALEPLTMGSTALVDAISQEIDDELGSSSSDSDDSSDDESDDIADGVEPEERKTMAKDGGTSRVLGTPTAMFETAIDPIGAALDVDIDPIAAALDAELASDSDDHEELGEDCVTQPLVQSATHSSAHHTEESTERCEPFVDAVPLAMPSTFTNGLASKVPDGVALVSDAIDAELASTSEDEGDEDSRFLESTHSPKASNTVLSELIREIKRPRAPRDQALSPFVASDGDAASRDKSDEMHADSGTRETTEHILQNKSRTLSLSSDSSSSSSSDSDGNDNARDPTQVVGGFVGMLGAITDDGNAAPNCRTSDKPTSPKIENLDRDAIDQAHSELKKRLNSEVIPDSTTDCEPDLKKRRLPSFDGSSQPPAPAPVPLHAPAPAPVQAHKSDEDARTHQPKRDVSSHTVAVTPRDLIAFKNSIALQEGESPDIAYVTRTLGVLVKHLAILFRASSSINEYSATSAYNLSAVKLCKTLTNEHIHRQIGIELLLEGMTRIFRTPRTRHAIDKSIVQLTSIFQIVFFLRLGISDHSGQSDAVNATTTMVPEVHQCLLTLRNLIVAPRLNDGLAIPLAEGMNASATSIAASSVRATQTVSHDKAFLGHVAAFYATICRALDRFDLPLVLLVDILKYHSNIKGLYCTHAVIQVDPRILRKRWNSLGREQQSALRATVVHVLQVITFRSRDKQEVVFKESALSLLSSVAEWVDDPTLTSIGPAGYAREIDDAVDSFARTFWRDHANRCITNTDQDAFEVSKALELLATFYGSTIMAQHFPITKFMMAVAPNSVESGEVGGDDGFHGRRQTRVAQLISCAARGAIRSGTCRQGEQQGYGTNSYVDGAVRWMLDSCRSDQSDNDEGLSAFVTHLTDLLIGLSPDEGMCAQRDRWLHELLQILSPQHLHRLRGQPLRQLRLLVMVARPLITI